VPEAFEINVDEKHVDENVTGKTLRGDLAAAHKAASAIYAHDQVIAGDDPTGFTPEQDAAAKAGVKAALELASALGGEKDHYRVSIHAGGDHINVHVQKTVTA
jgi:hypothetical protein